jgi:Zn-dependent M32 family carboxypeptidase
MQATALTSDHHNDAYLYYVYTYMTYMHTSTRHAHTEHTRTTHPHTQAELARGEFAPLLGWLRARVHSQGSLYDSLDELLVGVTGEPLNPAYFLDYLKGKYAALYGL